MACLMEGGQSGNQPRVMLESKRMPALLEIELAGNAS